jgi:amidase
MGLVRITPHARCNLDLLTLHREHGKEEVSEFTINKVECYYLMNEYLSKLKNTNIKTVEDVVRFNDENAGSQGASPGDHPAFPSGQVSRHQLITGKALY